MSAHNLRHHGNNIIKFSEVLDKESVATDNYQFDEGPKGPKLSWDYTSEMNEVWHWHSLSLHKHKQQISSTN